MLIGVAGKKRHGKDTIADYLVKKHGFVKIAFADPLKSVCKTLFGFSNFQISEDKETIDSYWGISPRQAFQFIGTDLFRKQASKLIPGIEERFWVEITRKRIHEILDSGKSIVVSDVRFSDESQMIKDFGGTVILVNRPGYDSVDTHESESLEGVNPDFVITNDSTLENLYRQTETILF